ncbi:uncharacterized protein [Typha angustifolia]|uniref:uncharacterized protein n=1 Tax=Typha angustifolia TaxID=59011 RepID=UPI003C2C88D4
MKGFKTRILRTLKSFPQVGLQRQQGRVLHNDASDEFFDASPSLDFSRTLSALPITAEEEGEEEEQEEEETKSELPSSPKLPDSQFISDKENIRPPSTPPAKDLIQSEAKSSKRPDLGLPSYRHPDLNSSTLFDPDLLAAFKQAIAEYNQSFEEAKTRARADKDDKEEDEEDQHIEEERPSKLPRTTEDYVDPLEEFQEKCPPGGEESIILYTTTLRGIRKTFEDCNSLRNLLDNLKLVFHERDISMDMGYREDLWRVLGWRAIPPRLFIRGRYIGGADEVIGIHEQGRLLPLLQKMPRDRSGGVLCEGCGGMRFAMCSECCGSRKLYDGERGVNVQCTNCNENGLIPCPVCSSYKFS